MERKDKKVSSCVDFKTPYRPKCKELSIAVYFVWTELKQFGGLSTVPIADWMASSLNSN